MLAHPPRHLRRRWRCLAASFFLAHLRRQRSTDSLVHLRRQRSTDSLAHGYPNFEACS
ncbi:MAG: hypothetical protein OXF08_00725 [Bacteroidetes bacterium]|nr:hypothetical protein [Bacteroidota bacterium]